MATGWMISAGYISGYSTDIYKEEAWPLLKETALAIAQNKQALRTEAIALAPTSLPIVYIDEVAATYAFPKGKGCPLSIYEPEGDDIRGYIHIMTSGNGAGRHAKEVVARAFVRILMRRMHQAGIDVNVSVG